MGKRNKKVHALCKRCGNRAYHVRKEKCGSCAYPEAKIRKYNWSSKAKRRRKTGTGRMRHIKDVARRFGNGFAETGKISARKY